MSSLSGHDDSLANWISIADQKLWIKIQEMVSSETSFFRSLVLEEEESISNLSGFFLQTLNSKSVFLTTGLHLLVGHYSTPEIAF